VPNLWPGSKNVEAFDNHNVGGLNLQRFTFDAVIEEVGIDRRADGRDATFELRDEPQEGSPIVAFGESFARQQPILGELFERQKETIGGNQRHLRGVGVSREQFGQHPRRGRFTHRNTAGDPNDEGGVGHVLAQKRPGDGVDMPGTLGVEGKKPGGGVDRPPTPSLASSMSSH